MWSCQVEKFNKSGLLIAGGFVSWNIYLSV